MPLPKTPSDNGEAVHNATTLTPIVYDPTTDGMYVKLRPGIGIDSRIDDARDLAVDLGEDGEPVGYDIQHASDHPDVVAEALRLMRRNLPADAAE